MANTETENVLGFVDKRRTPGAGSNQITTDANFIDVAALRARLTAVSATAYSASNLDKMTKNDMIFAIRQADELAGI
jgi:hypothetical protein